MRRLRGLSAGVIASFLLMSLAACGVGGDRPVAEGGGRLVLLDSIVLEEPDSLATARVSHLAWSPDGEYLVTDQVSARVLRFDAAGRLRGVIGRKGKGPGELGSGGPVGFLGDSVLVVEDIGRQRIFLFDRRNGRYLRSWQHEFGLATHLSVARDRVWLGMPNVRRGTSLLRWDPATDSAAYLVAQPAAFRGAGLDATYPYGVLAAWEDTVIVGWAIHDALHRTDAHGVAVEALTPPAVQRRPVPPDLAQRVRHRMTEEEQLSLVSLLFGAMRSADGRLLLMHVDAVADDARNVGGGGWLTVMTPDLDTACADIPLAAPAVGFPVLAMAGDTLLRIDQETTSGFDARTIIRRYRLDLADCAMLRVRRASLASPAR